MKKKKCTFVCVRLCTCVCARASIAYHENIKTDPKIFCIQYLVCLPKSSHELTLSFVGLIKFFLF